MGVVPRVAAINDLSGLGKCSLTAAIPILAAMGVQACPLPTAVLSNQTGFPSYCSQALTDQMEAAITQWKRQAVAFQGVYTGFLMDTRQVELAAGAIRAFRREGTLVLVDPVLGDNGGCYPVFGPDMVEAVGGLVNSADIITPNLTEACLLTGTAFPGHDNPEPQLVWELCRRLAELGPRIVVISGVGRNGELCNFAYLSREDRQVLVCNRRMGPGRSGTGDILASVLCGALVQGQPLEDGLRKATALLEASVADACAWSLDPNEGVPFERHLQVLMQSEK